LIGAGAKKGRNSVPTLDEKKEFLEKDFYNSLRWLFVSAVTWHAAKDRPERLFAMYTNFVEARSLYEFYYTKGTKFDDARALQFADSWTAPTSTLFRKYMDTRTPAQKRVFHLVYGRSAEANAGGPGHEHHDHLKNQVLKFAQNLRYITAVFIKKVRPEFRSLVQNAFDKALNEAKTTAGCYGIANPL
jgi:hypothetical protein